MDYHACLVLAPIMALSAGLLALRALDAGSEPTDGAATGSWWPVGGVICLPGMVLLINAVVVPNCSPATGLAVYLLGPVASAGVAVAMAKVIHQVCGRWRRAAFLLLATASCVPAAWHFLTSAQVSAYAPLVGHIAGALYEDVVEVQWCWVSYRLLDLALWACLIAAAHPRSVGRRHLPLALALITLAVGWHRAPLDGWRVNEAALERALPIQVHVDVGGLGAGDARSGRIEASAPQPALILHLPAGAELGWLRRQLARDAHNDYLILWSFFGRPAGETIHVHLYPDVATKHRLMGARQVEMAKPWLGQVHMALPGPGGTLLRHELAHVFAAPAGRWPLAIPLRGGWLPDALLIEGVAVAAEWPLRAGLDPHRQAHAMRALGLAPPLTSLLSPTGFFGQSGARAYTLAGSFVRWLVDRRGPQVLDRLYRDGDIAAAVGVPLQTLVGQWEAFVDGDPANGLTERDLAMAQARFEPSALLLRPCPLSIGRCRDRAGRAMIAGNFRRERDLREGLMETLAPYVAGRPLGPDLVLAQAAARARSGDAAAGLQAVQDWLAGARGVGLSRLRRAALLLASGDLRLLAGDVEGARAQWRAVEALPVADHVLRGLRVRSHLCQTDWGRAWLGASMLLGSPPDRWHRRVDALLAAAPDDPIARYLHGRAYLFRDETGGAVRGLVGLLPTLSDRWPLLAAATRRSLAVHAARLGQCDQARGWLSGEEGAGQRARRAAVELTCSAAISATVTTPPAIGPP